MQCLLQGSAATWQNIHDGLHTKCCNCIVQPSNGFVQTHVRRAILLGYRAVSSLQGIKDCQAWK